MDHSSVIYGLDDRPPLGRAVVLGLQHVLTMFGSTVAVPLLLAPQMGMSPTDTALLISSVMLCSGVATLLQSTLGSRLPIIQGVSFSFLAAFTTVIIPTVLAPASEGGFAGDGGLCMQYIAGAVILGALVEAAIGFSGLMGQVRKILSPVVVGPVIMLIGLALYQAGAPVAASHWPTSLLTMAMIIGFSLVAARHSLVFRLFPMLLAILAAVGLCGLLTATGVYGEGHPARVSIDAVNNAEWVRTTSVILPWGIPRFSGAFIVAVLAGYLASMIESFGDYHACSHMAGGGDPTPRQISRGIGFEGVACALTGVLGGFSSTSYSENVGLVGLTKVGSRYVVQVAGGMLVLLGLFGKFGAVAAAIPQPVVGGLYCVMFGLISAVGVRQFAKADLDSDRNLLIGGFAVFMGLSVPAYFGSDAGSAMLAELPQGVAAVVGAIGRTGMAVAAILGIALDNLIPGTKEERGLHDPGVLVPEAGDVGEGE
ncbi:Uric acid transporter UacT [Posidoniimonas polymericola]|uniref:Uric acid transporter UacT n=1 Tax=Posidoniimonas polymericola TaxID=2528002 RepID=A0A5C5YQE8_9BACT|nr:solute carrier family 23 protein [Posidoniimonas polymericola]TWT77136.1 Uric acid transporter UacT [Posidoniimonas polymericola]